VRVQGRSEETFGFPFVDREECAAVQDHRAPPDSGAVLRPQLELVQPGARGVRFTRANRSLDPIQPTPEDHQRGGDFPTAPERFLWSTEPQLQQGQRPVGCLEDDPEAASSRLSAASERHSSSDPRRAATSASRTSCCATRSCWPISRAS
jgi:hypothetical protein